MSLRPPTFAVDDVRNPFGNDLLKRQPRIEALARVISGDAGPAVVSINGGFGSGKSAFLKMLAAHLRLQHNVDVLEFDAWQQSHTGEPLVDVVSALAFRRKEVLKILLPAAVQLGSSMIRRLLAQASVGLSEVVLDVAEAVSSAQAEEPGFMPWDKTQARVETFRKALATIVLESGGKLVVIVDELDRCRPDYAIDMLNVVRHLFDVPGVVIALGVNRDELEHRVKEVFGPGTAADSYLRRFVDLPIDLGPLDELKLNSFTQHALRSAGLSGHNHSGSLKAVFELLLTETEASARDLEQLARRVATVLSGQSPQSAASQESAVGALILLRQLDRPAYESFVAGRSDALAAAAALRRHFGGVIENGTRQAQNTLEVVEAILMRFEDEQGRAAAYLPDFEERYVNSGLGDDQRAQRIRHAGGSAGVSWFLRPFADLIELFV